MAALTGLIGIGEVAAWYELFKRGTLLYTYRGHSSWVNSVAWSPNGHFVASASDDGTVQIWDGGDGGSIYTYQNHTGSVNAVAWSPDEQRIASASANDGTVQVWNASDGSNIYVYREYASSGNAVAWSPDGQRICSAGYNYTVQIWEGTDIFW